jgi:hypothetical protein
VRAQPPRQPTDGPVAVRWADRSADDGVIEVDVTTGGKMERITMSMFNAYRVFGMMALMLEVPLPKAVGKGIKL